jgi:threonine dehydrogenase-like Zn-dependent dehydrogenase
MRALQFLGSSMAEVVELETKPLPAGWARVKVHYNSVCGSDLWLYQGNWHGNRYPIVPGHEWSGVVTEVNGGDTTWVGRRVIGDLIHACSVCGPCRDGLSVMCTSLTEVGFTINGGCAEFVDLAVNNLYLVPNELSLAEACQVEPLAVALHAVNRAALRPAERVAVLGCGGIGLLILQAAQCAGGLTWRAIRRVRRDVASFGERVLDAARRPTRVLIHQVDASSRRQAIPRPSRPGWNSCDRAAASSCGYGSGRQARWRRRKCPQLRESSRRDEARRTIPARPCPLAEKKITRTF